MEEIIYKAIGTIHTPFESTGNMPIQPIAAKGMTGMVEVYPDYAAGLKDIEGFSHIILMYHFHLSTGYKLEVKPFLDDNLHGVFATRAPRRPNNIGLSVVKLIKVENNKLYIENVDIMNDTPLLDIKPFVPEFDATENITIGWLTASKNKFSSKKSDERFDLFF
jgi:tRNA-Thr(GGU) m(6)t(6)A37 methyltransferase TsaA